MTGTTKQAYFMQLATRASEQSHCLRRKVGAVIVDSNLNIKALTYNGPARGRPHCDEGHPCHGVNLAPGQDRCEGLHAEQSAVLAAGNTPDLFAIYVTEAPCFACAKFLLHTSIQTIYVPADADMQEHSKDLWLSAGRNWLNT
jgi:dCMP deaminase